jgi:hypothetical protein
MINHAYSSKTGISYSVAFENVDSCQIYQGGEGGKRAYLSSSDGTYAHTLIGVSTDQWAESACTISIDCPEVSSNKYDCVNGQCALASQYHTPGLFNSLEDCQAKCALNNGCDGTCINSADWSRIQQLANGLNRC